MVRVISNICKEFLAATGGKPANGRIPLKRGNLKVDVRPDLDRIARQRLGLDPELHVSCLFCEGQVTVDGVRHHIQLFALDNGEVEFHSIPDNIAKDGIERSAEEYLAMEAMEEPAFEKYLRAEILPLFKTA